MERAYSRIPTTTVRFKEDDVMPNRVLLSLAACFGSILLTSMSSAQDQSADPGLDTKVQRNAQSESFWMQQKLELSKKILQSLTMADYTALEEAAKKMRRISKFEGFVRRRNPVYRTQLKAFEKSNTQLVDAAKQKDADRALKAFHGITTSCIKCHQLLKDETL